VESKPAKWCLFKRNGPLWKDENGVWQWDKTHPVITLSNPVVSDPHLQFSSRICHSLLCFADQLDTRFLRLRVGFSSWVCSQLRRAYATFGNFCTGIPSIFSSPRPTRIFLSSVSGKSKASWSSVPASTSRTSVPAYGGDCSASRTPVGSCPRDPCSSDDKIQSLRA